MNPYAADHLVLLYDELDRYAKAPSPAAEPPEAERLTAEAPAAHGAPYAKPMWL